MAIATKTIIWQRDFSNLCDAPVEEIKSNALDTGHPALRFHDYWTRLPRIEGLPERQQFRPSAVPIALPWVLCFDALLPEDADDFQFVLRLHGSKASEMTYGDFTGKPLEFFVTENCVQSRRYMLTTTIYQKRAFYGRAKIHTDGEFITDATLGAYAFRKGTDFQVFVIVAPSNQKLRRLM